MSLDQQRAELGRLGFRIVADSSDRIVATARRFHWDCVFTWISYIVLVRRVEDLVVPQIDADRDEMQRTAGSIDPSALPRGLQKGTALLTVYVADRVAPAAQELLARKPAVRFASFYVPAALDQSTALTHFVRDTPMWGAIYYGKFRYLIQRLLVQRKSGSSWPLSPFGATLKVLLILMTVASVAIILSARR